jgi:hypothetical protein
MSLTKDVLLLLYLSIPFLLVAAALFVAGEYFVKGWDGLSLAIYSFFVLGAWVVVLLAWCAWIVLRDGFQPSSILPVALLFAALVGTGIWVSSKLLEQRRCAQSADFFAAFAAAAPSERTYLVSQGQRFISNPTFCGLDAVQYWFGFDPDGQPDSSGSDADRLAAIRQLLAAGLLPVDSLLYEAARSGDADLAILYAEFRSAAGLEPWPVRAGIAALEGYELASEASPTQPHHLATLRLFVENGADINANIENSLSLAERMDHAQLPWRDWLAAEVGKTSR